jgi:hypothetical protein
MGDDYITRLISGIFTGASSKQTLRYQWRKKLYGEISQYHLKKSYKVGTKSWSYYPVNNTLNTISPWYATMTISPNLSLGSAPEQVSFKPQDINGQLCVPKCMCARA